MKLNYLLLSGLMAAASAAPRAQTSHIVHEKRNLAAKTGFVKRDALASGTRIPVRIALKQRNLDKGMDYLMAVSDPDSPSYGKHYTPEQVVELFKPSDESADVVKKWLVTAGVPEKSIFVPKSQGWVSFDSTVEQLEDILQTKYHTYHHARTDQEHIGTDHYSLPEHVSKHVDFVQPAVTFQRKRSAAKKPISPYRPDLRLPLSAGSAAQYKQNKDDVTLCSRKVTPQCIKAMYGIPPGKLADPSNKMGIFELDGEVYAQEDLDNFFALAAPEIPKGTHPEAYIIGNTTASGTVDQAGGEATLDYDMAYPIVWPQGIVDFQTEYKEEFPTNLFDTFLDAIDGTYCTYKGGDDPKVDGTSPTRQCGTFKPTNVISISYGLAEEEYPVGYQKRQCEEYMKLGLQGVSLFLASGDYGVAEDQCLGPNADIFVSDQAAACPYMTAVGSTELPKGTTAGDEEIATARFGSGGGFSNIFPQPAYQKHAVNQWFKYHDPGFKNYTTKDGVIPDNGGIYNAGGRGYPDISAVGDYGLVWVGGEAGLSGGTSMSAPIVGAIINRINEERINVGKGPVGFINPVLYKYQEMFHDVVHGGMVDPQSKCKGKSFDASRGWDPVTGMGTPKYDQMLSVFIELP